MTGTNKKNSFRQIYLAIVTVLLIISALTYNYSDRTKEELITIGISRWGSNPEFGLSVEGFKQSLTESGYIEGKNIEYIVKNSETQLNQQRQIIQSFIDAKVDLIYSLTTPGTLIAKQMTEKMDQPIPVVFSICTYPVESNLIASLKSSKNHLVGTRNFVPFSQQYYIFERIFPHTKTLAVVHREGEPNSSNQFKIVKSLLAKRDINVIDIAAVDLEDIRNQLETNKGLFDSIYSTCDTLTHAGGEEIIVEFSKRNHIPTFACNKEGVLKGHLVGNIGDFKSIAKISGEKAALILKGAKPAWLRTESPRENYIIINQKTASEINIVIPQDVINDAKEIITE
ncbi:MAG: ABC transporter substrate-binding protein [Colwellia sp.]|nr:ABC transporter substrate-binding protein [Colwellia sp.]